MTQPDNLGSLVSLSGRWIDRIAERRPMTAVMLDMDSSVSPTFGDQENTAYNGHFGCICCHPLFVFNQFGDLERCALRPGNVHSADGWRDVLEPVVARYRNRKMRRFFRADAAFANPEVYEFMEAEGTNTRSGSPPIRFFRNASPICSSAQSAALPLKSGGTTPTSAIRRKAGRHRAAWWRKSNGILANSIHASALS
jgi:hypothetical protein